MSASIKSVEDHGYVLDIGLPDVSGFLRRKEDSATRRVGGLFDVTVDRLADDGRTCHFSCDPNEFTSAVVSSFLVLSSLPGSDSFVEKRYLLCSINTSRSLGPGPHHRYGFYWPHSADTRFIRRHHRFKPPG